MMTRNKDCMKILDLFLGHMLACLLLYNKLNFAE